MADIEYGEAVHGNEPARAIDMAGVANWAGAVISAALIAGLAWWGYQLMVRDVTGVPVVRALEGPMRVAPEDPGGESAQYQGLAVNNIAAVGQAEAPADRLVLAPKPTLLTPEDQPEAALAPLAAETAPDAASGLTADTADAATAATSVAAAPSTAPDPATANEVAQAVESVDQATLIEATLKQLSIGTPQAQVAPVARRSAAIIAPEDIIPAAVPGVSRSLRPLLRPAAVLSLTAQAVVTGSGSAGDAGTAPAAAPETALALATPAATLPDVVSVDPASIPVGTRLVQLGAFDSVDVAKSEWTKIAARFEDFMVGKARVIEKAQSGGKVFYRLRVQGFDNLSDARRFCSALLAGDASCIPVVTR